MAEEQRKRRRLKSSGETVRERTEKQKQKLEKAEEPKQGNILTAFWAGFTWPLRLIGRGIAGIFRFLSRFRVFRIIGRILLPKYIRNSWRELRLVTWPDRVTSWKLTYAVVIFSILFGLIVAGVDFVLGKIFKELIIK